jgi:hypothetical protein
VLKKGQAPARDIFEGRGVALHRTKQRLRKGVDTLARRQASLPRLRGACDEESWTT